MNELNEKCIFCKIIKKEIPCPIVYEDEKVLAFLDSNPVNKGHTLVIPKIHYKNIYDTPDEILGYLMISAKKIAIKLKESIGAEGVNIHMNNEAVSGQVVFHTHLHIIPRFTNDGFTHWKGSPYKEGEAEEILQKIKSK
jgi:histidine triad (HIT) family protein